MTDKQGIVIVGGGPVGSVLALALQANNINVTILEARAKGASHGDQRALALSYGSRIILEQLGIWSQLESKATAINSIHISQKGSFGRTKLDAQEYNQPALGYVLSYGALSAALDEALNKKALVRLLYQAEASEIKPAANLASVTYKLNKMPQTVASSLVVLADGGSSLGAIEGIKRETKEYGHDALVTKVKCELPHNNIAYERFTPMGPLALLPNVPSHDSKEFSLVWTGKQEVVAELMALDDASFLHRLHVHFGDRVGQFLQVEKRTYFPLKMASLKPTFTSHLVVIGNAAQTMHPVAGQGFNVGLRDAWQLAEMLNNSVEADIGSISMLSTYHATRSQDTKRGLMFTDFLVNVFSNDIMGVSLGRAAALGLLDVLKPVKNRLVSKMSFGK